MSEVDLHCHTHYSDGSLSVPELIQRALANGVKMLAITDHDSVAAHDEIMQRAEKWPIRLIPAVEISSSWHHRDIHVVALNIDHENHSLRDFLQQQFLLRQARAKILTEKMETRLKISDVTNKISVLAKGGIICRSHFAQLLVNEGKAKDFRRAFEKFLKKGKIASVKSHWPDLKAVIAVINQAGGYAVLAHPTRYKLNNSTLYELVEQFAKYQGHALEAAYPGIKPQQQRRLIRLAKTFSLSVSKGSDFHHSHQTWADLGKVPLLPADIQPIWEHF